MGYSWGTSADDNINLIKKSGNSIFVYSIGSFGYSVHKNQYCNSGVIRMVSAATLDNCMTLCDNNPSCRTFEWYSGLCRTSTTCRHTNFKTERGRTIYQKGSTDSDYSLINRDCYTKYANPYSTDWFGNRGNIINTVPCKMTNSYDLQGYVKSWFNIIKLKVH